MADSGFEFGFFSSTERHHEQQQPQQVGAEQQRAGQLAEACTHAEEVPPAAEQQADGHPWQVVQLDSGVSLLKGSVSSEAAAAMLGRPELESSDLLPNEYEGGFKLWEGALDLCNYLIREHHVTADMVTAASTSGSSMQGKKVLELGCGHGLPGILCQLAGAVVHYQDFNRAVLTSLTQSNLAANLAQVRGGCRSRARFFAGDWTPVGTLLSSQGLGGYYDLILTAETIYSTRAQQRLLDTIKQVLRPPHGVVLLAAKSFYFGVGGSTAGFAELVRVDGVLECVQVWKVEDGHSNKREILRLSFPESISPYFM